MGDYILILAGVLLSLVIAIRPTIGLIECILDGSNLAEECRRLKEVR